MASVCMYSAKHGAVPVGSTGFTRRRSRRHWIPAMTVDSKVSGDETARPSRFAIFRFRVGGGSFQRAQRASEEGVGLATEAL